MKPVVQVSARPQNVWSLSLKKLEKSLNFFLTILWEPWLLLLLPYCSR